MAFISNESMLNELSDTHPKGRERPPKHYHPLLPSEKQANTTAKGISQTKLRKSNWI